MKTKTRNLVISTAIAAAVGATGVAVADMGGYGAGCAQMQQGQGGHGMGYGRMQGQGGHGMMGGMMQGHGMMGQGMQDGMMGQGMRGGMGQGLDLSDEQRAEMGKIRQQFLPKMGELRGRMQANHEQLRAMLHGGGAMDETTIATLADQRGDLMAEMIKLRAAHRTRMQALMTDEQREQMRQHRQGMGGGMMDGGMMGAPRTDG